MRDVGVDEAQTGIKISGRNFNNLRYANDSTLIAESKEELKTLLMKVIHTVKGLGIVNKAGVDVFQELSCLFYDQVDVGNLISGSSAFFKTSLNIWKFTVLVLLSLAWRILSTTLALPFFGIGIQDDAVKVLHSICLQIWKTQQWPQDWKRSVFIPIPKKGNAKECSNYRTIAVISHASKIMHKILQPRLQL